MRFIKILLYSILLMFEGLSFGQQTLNGTIVDEKNVGVPFAQVYIKNASDLRTQADINGYFEMRLISGEYFLVINATGYEDREAYVSISDRDVTKNIQLFTMKVQDMEAVDISVKKGNPGRDIMLKVVEKRDKINPWNYDHSCEGYIRATEKIEHKELSEKEKLKQEKRLAKKNNDSTKVEIPDDDPFKEDKKATNELMRNMNLVEVQFTRHFSPPNKVKEIRNAFEQRGTIQDLYYTTTVKSNFNFFENLLHLDDLHQSPVSSPISLPGILSYKYRLMEQYEENGVKIHKIKIIPRSTATTTLEGYIWVIDSLWLIQKLELTMEKGNLLVYDHFTIQQEFTHPGDTLCVLTKQVLTYGVKYKNETTKCSTLATFSDYNFKPNFTPKFFNKELSVTDEQAYEKDTAFWNKNRSFVLTDEEQKFIIAKDSVYDYQHRTEYLDSIDSLFNKITILKVLWFGIEHRNRAKKVQWSFNPVAALIQPIYIAGPRISMGFSWYKKWNNQRYLDSRTELSVGFKNSDIKGYSYLKYLFNPFHFSYVSTYFYQGFESVRGYDAITQIFKRSNYFESTKLNATIGSELWNGLYVNTTLNFSERRNIEHYKFVTVLDEALNNNEAVHFITYQALVAAFELEYTPAQKYMREPNRKVVLGSRWPTFYLNYERGVPRFWGSDVDFEYALVGLMQTFKIGTIGTSSYNLKTGKFLSSKELKDADFKYNRRSDPIWFSNPLYSFQGLKDGLPSKKLFLEGHFVHHDNGSIINKIPFMKKTGIGLVVGCGALYIKEFDWQHYELFTGLERSFKFSRRKLRIGIYGVLSDGNHIEPTTNWKLSFAILDLRNMKWNF